MSSATKGALKAAKAAIDSHKYEEAERHARSVLETDPKHYTAAVFLGLALEKQGNISEAERVYLSAKRNKPKEVLALQGLQSVYEQQAAQKVDEYGDVSRQLADFYAAAEDLHKCQSIVDKYVGFAKQHGTATQYKNALVLMLPDSPIYDFLQGRLPHPSQTYSRVIEITETEESKLANKLIGERRTRIGAKIGDVTTEVKLEIYRKSDLEKLYQDVINWSLDDDIRRKYEERLLQRAYDTLAVLPSDGKAEKRQEVQKLAEGMVILKHPYSLAWNITFDWSDYERIADYDVSLLRNYVSLFPEDGLAKILNGYLESDFSPFPKLPREDIKAENENGEGEEAEIDGPLSAEDRLIIMSEGLEQSARSITSQRLMGEYYLALEEYSTVVGCAKKMLELLELEKSISGLELQNSIDAANVTLGTAFVHHESPRNHPKARQLFEGVVERTPTNTAALIGLGLILEEETEYEEAIEFFERVLQTSTDIRIKSEAAWCRTLMGDYVTGLQSLKKCLEEFQSSKDTNKDLLSLLHYRIGNAMWNQDTSRVARKDRNGAYAHFLASLKANVHYAPAYTSLGYYYADYGKDRIRARKCFQKAFELSVSEVDAAERLARLFADQKDWELMEAVSERVIDSGKVRPPPGSKKKGISWPFAALGVCQLNNQEYPKSIASFQAALRFSPEDFHSWIGLGESYHGLGRHIAAIKAFEHAISLQSNNKSLESTWFARYMLANVKRELGYYEDAIDAYDAVLEIRSDEVGVALALLQTYVDYSWSCVSGGLFGKAIDICALAIEVAGKLVNLNSGAFNLWKALGDICSLYTWAERYSNKFPSGKFLHLLEKDREQTTYEYLNEIDHIDWETSVSLLSEPQGKKSTPSLNAAILCQKRAIHCVANDTYAQAVAWYNLGWTEYRASSSIALSSKEINQLLRAAVQCFKKAIELESGNSEFWDALGIVTTKLNPKVAQHSFVRSLHLNDRSAKTWTNLGTLYLLENDFQLANEAFTRGQSSDPEYAHAWLGQGVLALITGDLKEAHGLFTHAFEIADATSLIVKKLYSATSFDHLLSSDAHSDSLELLQPLFALHQLRSQKQGDEIYLHLSALMAERLGDTVEPSETLEEVCTQLEEDYERSESSIVLGRFAQAKADLARAYLASGDFDAAIENAETALDLSAEEETGSANGSERLKYRLSAHITSGLAHSSSDNAKSAIAMFREALQESGSDPDIVTVLSQILWARGGQKEQDVAREQLFDCLEKHPGHIGATSLLAVIAILDNDRDTLQAVSADLDLLRTHDDLGAQNKVKVTRLLAAVNRFLQPSGTGTGIENIMIADASNSIMLEPSTTDGWSLLASLSQENTFPADMALITAQGSVPPKGHLDATELAAAFAGTGLAADAQKAIMFAPWLTAGWETLA
ncbi:MAG: hypothetical protein GOMPHAMPRED_002080 [Gomphillus americanus]|uniref:Superkiller protein 3 n=1 Tax=Gomphillus americanus TaxID=1940652 RepID=A0A8H3IM65_9LECA|nr:MAG: hypothetical protein GOMPHAMPRED_002080 [Gomphillus americanus]